MNEKDALEIQAADKIECKCEELEPHRDKCPNHIACEELECRFEEDWHSLLSKSEGYTEAVANSKLPLRDKEDRDLIEDLPDIDGDVADFEDEGGALDSLDLDKKSTDGCPTCGNEDIQSAELLEAWKEIERLKKQLEGAIGAVVVPADANVDLIKLKQKAPIDQIIPGSPTDWKDRYEQIKKAYVRTRLEVSGSFGNWDYNTRKRVLEHEISTELGFTV